MNSRAIMSEFKRSPSKVWWGNDSPELREASSSPGSQDSGFSDVETSPNQPINDPKNFTPAKLPPVQTVPKEIFKESNSAQTGQNLSVNYKEKVTPEKARLNGDRLIKSETKNTVKRESEVTTPNTEPARKHRFMKNSPKVSRSLFLAKQKNAETNQYAKEVQNSFLDSSVEATVGDSYACCSNRDESYATKSLPVIKNEEEFLKVINKSAPGVLERFEDNERVTSFNSSLSSDCDSELECLFNGPLDSPRHTSTPKTAGPARMGPRNEKLPLNLLMKYHNERVPPTDNSAVQKWLEEVGQMYEQECMTTLQCKSIAAELNQKVSHLAAGITSNIRSIISNSKYIEKEYENLNGETRHIDPLIQSLTGNIIDFLKTYTHEVNSRILKICDEIRMSKSGSSLDLLSRLFGLWNNARQDLLAKQVTNLVNQLECPSSELDLRAVITGITSISLRNEELIELFTRVDIIPILLILCEKCEGSSLRSLILRALATMCCNSSAIRHFEKFSGVQIIADTLDEESRPEPERSEAVALLAQVTAPWLEDNHSVKGLQEYSRKMVKSLTKFAGATKCCQNLLLCAAALANLTTMDSKAIKYAHQAGTVEVLLEVVRTRGSRASVYLLEQVATLIASISSYEPAREHLTRSKAAVALLSFLKTSFTAGEEVEKRLQQKSIIGLSRLCGDKEAAKQVVQHRGVEKLVRLCRERQERHGSDAVLVAALATLRKVCDSCGTEVLSVQDAQELVEPKLLDSFLAYSTQNESYV